MKFTRRNQNASNPPKNYPLYRRCRKKTASRQTKNSLLLNFLTIASRYFDVGCARRSLAWHGPAFDLVYKGMMTDLVQLTPARIAIAWGGQRFIKHIT